VCVGGGGGGGGGEGREEHRGVLGKLGTTFMLLHVGVHPAPRNKWGYGACIQTEAGAKMGAAIFIVIE
jgi:hypothetical protein